MTLLTPEFLQTKTYAAQRMRYAQQHMKPGIAEGLIDEASLKVSQRGAGANMSVDVAAGAIFVQGDDTVRQGFYHLVNDATVNVAVSGAHATLPRIDAVVGRIYDSSVVGVSDVPQIEVIAGTPTTGAQSTDPEAANYRLGAAALPNGAMHLADVQVDAAVGTIVTAKIRDKRQRTRGVSDVAAAESRSSTTYGLMTTPDIVPNLVVPANGIIVAGFQGRWQNSVVNNAIASLFIGPSQLRQSGALVEAALANAAQIINTDYVIGSGPAGLITSGTNTAAVATGQAIGAAGNVSGVFRSMGTALPSFQAITDYMVGGPCFIFVQTAGVYDLTVRWKVSTSGSVTAKERKLWAFVLDPTQLSL